MNFTQHLFQRFTRSGEVLRYLKFSHVQHPWGSSKPVRHVTPYTANPICLPSHVHWQVSPQRKHDCVPCVAMIWRLTLPSLTSSLSAMDSRYRSGSMNHPLHRPAQASWPNPSHSRAINGGSHCSNRTHGNTPDTSQGTVTLPKRPHSLGRAQAKSSTDSKPCVTAHPQVKPFPNPSSAPTAQPVLTTTHTHGPRTRSIEEHATVAMPH
jgi:hypothetical protein